MFRIRSFFEGVRRFKAALDHVADRLLRVESRVGREDHVRKRAQDGHLPIINDISDTVVVVKSVLILQYIERRAADLSALQGIDERRRVDQLSPSRIHDENPLPHLREGIGIQKVIILRGRVRVQCNRTALLVQLIQGDILRVLPGFFILTGIVAQDPAAEAGQMSDHRRADPPGPDDADRLEADVIADLSL